MSWSRAFAVVAWITVLALDAVLLFLGPGFPELFPIVIPLLPFTVIEASVGLLIELRRPDNTIGRLLVGGPILMLSGLVGYTVAYLRFATAGADDLVGGLGLAWGVGVTIHGIVISFLVVAILFPDGRLPSAGWRLPFGLLVALMATSVVTGLGSEPGQPWFPRNPLTPAGAETALFAVSQATSSAAVIGAMLLAILSIAVRWRRARGIERQQLKWFTATAAIAAVLLPVALLNFGPTDVLDVASVLTGALVPLAIGIAVLRYRLYEIDRLVSRTVTWGLLSAILVAVYAGAVLVFQGLLGAFTQRQTFAVAASTLIAAAVFQPLRRRVQEVVDSRFDRARYDAEQVVGAFAGRLRDHVDLQVLGVEVGRVAGEAVRPRSVGLWLRPVPERHEMPLP